MSPRPVQSRSLFATLAAAPLVVAFASMISGCPLYAADSCAEDPACSSRTDAGPADVAPETTTTGCGTGCEPGYTCTNQSSGTYECVAYDCRASEKACTDGKTCVNAEGVWKCVAPGATDCSATGCITGYACGDLGGKKVCLQNGSNTCYGDGECIAKTGAGSLCLGGECKAPKDLCTDSTQCNGSASCVDGRCVPKCTTTCASGYTCDSATGLCTGGSGVCGASKACTTGTCVNERCVQPAETNGTCPAGTVSVAGGCVIDDRPIFFCDNDGTKDGTQDKCAAGSICLHHNCYISCTGVGDTTSCKAADKFPVCKSVTTSSGSHFVCGSDTSLGSQCDLTASPPKTCSSGKVCIDGFCK